MVSATFHDFQVGPLVFFVNYSREQTNNALCPQAEISFSRQHMDLKSHYVNNSCYRLNDWNKTI